MQKMLNIYYLEVYAFLGGGKRYVGISLSSLAGLTLVIVSMYDTNNLIFFLFQFPFNT